MLVLLLFISFFLSVTPVQAETYDELTTKISEYTQKLNDLSKEKDTLSNAIQTLDSQISLTSLKIQQTEAELKKIQLDISDLSIKINDLDKDLNTISASYIAQVTENYKLEKKSNLFYLFASKNFNNYLNQIKYISNIQKHNKELLTDMTTKQVTYEEQKRQKNLKQIEKNTLQDKLKIQQKSYSQQKVAKNNLLTVTKNDEKKYQQLLTDAQNQLRQLKSFSNSAGGLSCLSSSPGNGSDGNFYSQRDPAWCRQYMGNSKDTIGDVGCFITSISMAYKKLGTNITPSVYALDPLNFVFNTAYATIPEAPSGYTYRQTSYSSNTIDNELKSGRYVIVQLKMSGSVSGMHFVVIISGSNGNYKIHDPWYGPDQDFTEHYSISSIMSLRLFTK